MANQNMTGVALQEASTPRLAETYQGGTCTEVVVMDTMEVTALAANDTVVLCRIPVDARLTSLKMASDDIATTSITCDIGLYEGFSDGVVGSVVVDDCIASAVDFDGATAYAELLFEANNIANTGKTAWEIGGLSARPSYGNFDVVLHVNAATGGQAGTVSFILKYLKP